MRPTRQILAGLAALVAASITLASCAKAKETRDQFETIDKAISELNLGSLGTLRLDERLGRVGFAQQPPTRVLVFERSKTSAAGAVALIRSTLRQAGYEPQYVNQSCGPSSPCHFRRLSDNVTVGLVVYQPGQAVMAPTADNPKYVTKVPDSAVVTSMTFGNE